MTGGCCVGRVVQESSTTSINGKGPFGLLAYEPSGLLRASGGY